MVYLIDKKIEFHLAENKLVSHDDYNHYITITAPASRCLALLLDNAPDIVKQQQFIDAVWGDYGMLVTMNTLYQNISIIRRGLRFVSENDHHYIRTISRKGFQISNQVSIEVIHPQVHPVNNSLNTIYAWGKRLFFLLMFTILMEGFYQYGNLVSYGNNSFFDYYYALEKLDKCSILYDGDAFSDYNSAKYASDKIRSTGVDCKKNKWLYLSRDKEQNLFTAISCNHPLSQRVSVGCKSIILKM